MNRRVIKFTSLFVFALLLLALVACAAPPPTPVPPTQVPATTAPSAPPQATSAPSAPPQATSAPQPPTSAPQAAKGGKLVYGNVPEPDTLDPASTFSSWAQIELKTLYDTLVWWGPDRKYYPGLAQSWEVSADGKVYTFKLRQGVKFHDGTTFNAAAVKYTFDRIGKVKTTIGKGAAGLMGSYDSTTVVDDNTVKVNFKNPFPAFLSSASDAFLSIISPTAADKWGDDFGRHPAGTGPFVLKEWATADHLTVERNPDYKWGPSFFKHAGPAYLESVTFRYIVEDATRVACLEKGECQFIGRVPELDVDRLKGDKRFQLLSADTPMMPESILLNSKKAPLDDIKVRQAILYAVDRKAIVDTVYKGVHAPAFGPLSPSVPGYWKGVEDMYPYNPEKSKALLTDASWKPGSDGIRVDKDGKRLSLDLLFPPRTLNTKVYEFVQAQLREVGIEMKLQGLESAAMFEKAVAGQNHLSQLQWGFSDATGLNIMWNSKEDGKGFNWSHIQSKEVDDLLAQGDATADPTKREAIYQQLQKTIMDQAWDLPLWVVKAYHGASTKVHDVVVAPTARHTWLLDAHVDP